MAKHQRVEQIRAESGIPTLPRSTPPPVPESEEIRNARLNELQRESLGSSRRDRISREDFPDNQRNQVSWKQLEALRLSNKPGTKENEEFQANKVLLSGWTNAWTELEDDGTMEERFDDINHGQAHRAKLMSDPGIRKEYGGEDMDFNLRRHHADNSGRAQGGGRGGRGGGVAGSRPRASGPKRVPVGIVATGIPTTTQRPRNAVQASPPARGGAGSSRGALSPTHGGSPGRGSPRSAHGEDGPSSPSRESPSPGRPSRSPRDSGWEFRLADPADFVTAFRGSLVLPSTVASVTKSTTAPVDAALPSSVTPLTRIKEASAGTASPSLAPHLTAVKVATGDPKKDYPVTGKNEQSPTTDPREQTPPVDSYEKSLSGAAPEQPLADPRKESSTIGPSEQPSAEGEPVSSTAPLEGEQEEEDSALIDFGDASDSGHGMAYSHKTGDEAKAVTPPLTLANKSEQSYTGDLLGLDIQPDAGQTLQFQRHRTNPVAGGGSIPSIVDIHNKMSSFTPLLKEVLDPESVKSFENIITELQLKSKGAARTSVAAPGIEPPTAAFGRLSIHEHDANLNPTSIVAEDQTAEASRHRSTVSSDNLAAATKDPLVAHPRVRLPPPYVHIVETAGNVQQNPSPHPSYSISRPHVGINVHEQVAGIAVGASVSPPVSETEVPNMTANQKVSFKLPAGTSKLTGIYQSGTEKNSSEKNVSEGSLPGQSAIEHPAKAHTRHRGNILGAREQFDAAITEEAKVDEPAIFRTLYPNTSGTTINLIGFYKGQALESRKENVPSAGKHDGQAEASGSKPRAVLGEYPFTVRVAASNVTANAVSVPAQTTTIADPKSAHPAPATKSKLTATAKPFILPHAQSISSDVAPASVSVPSNPSNFGMPGAVSSEGQLKSEQPTAASMLAVEADKEGEEDEEDYPLDSILTTTFVPSGPSMLNRTGFFKR